MVNVIVAFGVTDDSYFIASGDQTYRNELPTRMDAAVASVSVGTPYHFASIGHGGRFFISGGNTSPMFEGMGNQVNNVLNAHLKTTTGITFGDGGAWAWFNKSNLLWQSGNFSTNTNSWLHTTKSSLGKNFWLILGAGGATVLLYPNGKYPHTNCSTLLSNMLYAATDKGFRIRYLALSPNNREWFFVHFEDDSITWHTRDTHGVSIASHFQEIANRHNLNVRSSSTLAVTPRRTS